MNSQPLLDVSGINDDSDPGLLWQVIADTAIASTVSDIHLLAQRGGYQLLFRVDGDLRPQGKLPVRFCRHLINHVKAAAGMDLSETRRPVEGHIRMTTHSRKVDLRLSTVPSLHGMDMVARLFDRHVSLLDLNQLGLAEQQLGHLQDILERPSGLILVSGPSGSGKTTTLYAMLRRLTGKGRKIATIEDPIEYDLDDVAQTQVNYRLGVTFPVLLSALMRQDPDVIMVGEIRDQETAVTAVRAANTGHLVLATTHAARASRSVETMLSLGSHPYFLASSLRAVVAQVLVKRICSHCRAELPETADMLVDDAVRRHVGDHKPPRLYIGKGCQACAGSGYNGRMALFEVMRINEAAQRSIAACEPNEKLEESLRQEQILTLQQSAKLAALAGETTMEEIVRALPDL